MKELLKPTDIIITKVFGDKFRIKYKIPCYHKENKKMFFLGYHNMNIMIKEKTSSLDIASESYIHFLKYNTPLKLKENEKLFGCYKQFQKFLTKISNFYGVKYKFIKLPHYTFYQTIDDINMVILIPEHIILEGKEINNILRKRKIQKLLEILE